jgi:pyrimidine-nucleoside phosphorylase
MSQTDLRELIAIKRDGGTLSPDQIGRFVQAAAEGSAPEVHLASMLMAIFCRGLSTEERTGYALAMMRSGDVLDWTHLDRPTADKHSTGGVGDKVSLIWAPLMAAVGFAVPMISGRGLGHTGGTLDKLESIPGFRTDLDTPAMDAALRATGCVLVGQTARLVPADRTLYALRSRTATVPTVDHIAPSIMSKKLAEGAESLVLDVKVGSGAFMKTQAEARQLADVMVAIGQGAGRRVAAVLSDMSTPLGCAVGNALEVVESVECLCGRGPADLRELVLDLAQACVLESKRAAEVGLPEEEEPLRDALAAALDDGRALAVFERVVEGQGGDVAALHAPERLAGMHDTARSGERAETTGLITAIDALDVGLAAAALGGGRGANGEAPHPGVGVVLGKKIGDRVAAGEVWAWLHHAGGSDVEAARGLLDRALVVAPE